MTTSTVTTYRWGNDRVAIIDSSAICGNSTLVGYYLNFTAKQDIFVKFLKCIGRLDIGRRATGCQWLASEPRIRRQRWRFTLFWNCRHVIHIYQVQCSSTQILNSHCVVTIQYLNIHYTLNSQILNRLNYVWSLVLVGSFYAGSVWTGDGSIFAFGSLHDVLEIILILYFDTNGQQN